MKPRIKDRVIKKLEENIESTGEEWLVKEAIDLTEKLVKEDIIQLLGELNWKDVFKQLLEDKC